MPTRAPVAYRIYRKDTSAVVSNATIIGAAEVPYTRHPAAGGTTARLISGAIRAAIRDAGLTAGDIDGLAVSSFTLRPDHAVDLAVRNGLHLRWIMEDTNGGASAINMLQHAVRAVENGDATNVVIAAGDYMAGDAFRDLVTEYNAATRDHISPLGVDGPNVMFSMLTQRHAEEHDLDARTYGAVSVAQRRWAGRNSGALYRTPLSMEEYLAAPMVATPLRRFDCVPVVTGADAIVVSGEARRDGGIGARVRAIGGMINRDDQSGNGLVTGLVDVADAVWNAASVAPSDIDLISVYDDYPVMVLIQLADLGFVPDCDFDRTASRLLEEDWPVNTSGGQLSCGQAGAAGGLHGLVEAVTQLRGRAGYRQVKAALAAVTGYGMVAYRYGACANLAVLEAT